jgi:hypothetical protein
MASVEVGTALTGRVRLRPVARAIVIECPPFLRKRIDEVLRKPLHAGPWMRSSPLKDAEQRVFMVNGTPKGANQINLLTVTQE